MALTKVTGQVINTTTDLVVGVTTVGGGISATDAYFSGITTLPNTTESTSTTTGSLIVSGGVGIAKNLSIGGSVSIGGTLTYEDVTNIDSVGLITARNGVSVTGGTIKVGSGITLSTDGDSYFTGVSTFVGTSVFKDDVTFQGASANITFDKSTDDLIFNDNAEAKFGTGGDLRIYHNGSHNYIYGSTASQNVSVVAESGYINLQPVNNEEGIIVKNNGAVELYHDNAKRLSTTSTGVDVQTPGADTYMRVLGGEGGDAILRLHADEGDDGPDVWSIFAAQADGKLKIQNGASGSWENSINCNGDGGVDLFHDNVNTFSTMSSGAIVKTGNATSYITFDTSAGTCGFVYANSNTDMSLLDREGHYFFKGTKDGASEVFYDNSSKIVTTSTGCQLKSGAANTTKVHIGTTADRGLEITTVSDGSNNDAQVVFNAADTTSSGYHANLVFQLADVEKARLHGNGDYFALSNTCTGITFGGDYADANRLDDYEEGTFTPAITSGLAGGSIAYNSRSGRYTKIGNLVTFSFHMNISSCSLDSGQLKFGGLPKTAVDNGHLCGAAFLSMSNGNMGSTNTYRVVADSTDIEVITAAGDAYAANSSSLNAGNRALSMHGSYYAAGN